MADFWISRNSYWSVILIVVFDIVHLNALRASLMNPTMIRAMLLCSGPSKDLQTPTTSPRLNFIIRNKQHDTITGGGASTTSLAAQQWSSPWWCHGGFTTTCGQRTTPPESPVCSCRCGQAQFSAFALIIAQPLTCHGLASKQFVPLLAGLHNLAARGRNANGSA